MSGLFNVNYSRQPNILDRSMVDTGVVNPYQSPVGQSTADYTTTVPSQNQGSNWFQSWGSPALQGLGSIMAGWNGWQQTKVAREGLKESKRQFNMNWEAQKNLTNNQLYEQQRRRIAAQGGIREGQLTPEEYQMQWGIK